MCTYHSGQCLIVGKIIHQLGGVLTRKYQWDAALEVIGSYPDLCTDYWGKCIAFILDPDSSAKNIALL